MRCNLDYDLGNTLVKRKLKSIPGFLFCFVLLIGLVAVFLPFGDMKPSGVPVFVIRMISGDRPQMMNGFLDLQMLENRINEKVIFDREYRDVITYKELERIARDCEQENETAQNDAVAVRLCDVVFIVSQELKIRHIIHEAQYLEIRGGKKLQPNNDKQ